MDGLSVPDSPAAVQEAFWATVDQWTRRQLSGLLEQVLLSEQQSCLLAGWNERSDGRTGWRNGYYHRKLLTPHGLLQVKIPRCRRGQIDCSMIFDRYQRRLADVDRILRRAYLVGCSTRATAELAEQVFGGHLSHQTVSQLMRWLDQQLEAWRQRPIDPIYRVVCIDGMHLDVQGGDQVVVLAMGLCDDGRKEVLGFSIHPGERCRGLLEDLRRRGLENVELFVSDESSAIRHAVADVFPESAWQHCTFHRLQALRSDLGAVEFRQQMVQQAADVFRCPTKLAAVDRALAWARQWRQQAPWAVQQFMENLTDSLTFYSLPKDRWRTIRTNNYLERLIRTLRMRLRNMGCHYDTPAVERAVFGQLARWHLLGTYTQ
jgi:transposase-like protein